MKDLKKKKEKKKDIMVCEEVRINIYGFTPITAMAIIYIYVLFIVVIIGFIFNFFYCYYIILEKKKFLRAERKKKGTSRNKKWLKNVGGKAIAFLLRCFNL